MRRTLLAHRIVAVEMEWLCLIHAPLGTESAYGDTMWPSASGAVLGTLAFQGLGSALLCL